MYDPPVLIFPYLKLHLQTIFLSVSIISDCFVPAAMRRPQQCDLPASASCWVFYFLLDCSLLWCWRNCETPCEPHEKCIIFEHPFFEVFSAAFKCEIYKQYPGPEKREFVLYLQRGCLLFYL